MHDDLPQPLFAPIRPERGPRLSIVDAADLIGLPKQSLRSFIDRRFVHFERDLNGLAVLSPSDVGAAAVMSSFFLSNVHDRDATVAASLACYSARPEQPFMADTPIWAALNDDPDHHWMLDIRRLADIDGTTQWRAWLHWAEDPPAVENLGILVALVVVPVTLILRRVRDRLIAIAELSGRQRLDA